MKTIRPDLRQLIWLVVPTLCSLLYAAESVPQGLDKSDWHSIRQAYEAGRHAFQPVEGGWQARNPGQQWTTIFDKRGFLATPKDGRWTWGLELKSYGFGQNQQQIQHTPSVKADGQRLSYRWDDTVEEWFINDRRGLEHGFNVAKRPDAGAAAKPEPLAFLLATRGGLRPAITADGQGVIYQDTGGAAVLNYTGLKVTDANGETLTSRFETVGEDAVRLLVEERNARYPITIDPVAQQAYLKASNTGAGDEFGISVAISGDTVVVGAYGEDSSSTGVNSTPDESASKSGAAYVFVRSGTTWTQQAYLKAGNTGTGDWFGISVAISGDTIVIGARDEDSSTTGVNSTSNNSAIDAGAAYVFVRSGTTWTQQAYLKASNTGTSDFFGANVAISGDTVIVGAELEDSDTTGVNSSPNNSAVNSGAAYVFVRSGTTWTQQAYLKASNTGANDDFGYSVSVSGDTVVIGAAFEDSSTTGVNSSPNNSAIEAGAAYVFVRSGTTWTQQAYLKASNTGANDLFGCSASVCGNTVVVGARQEDSSTTGINSTPNESAADSGAAYVFVRSGTAWTQQAYLKPGNSGAGDEFGAAINLCGDAIVVGAAKEDSNTTGVNSTPNEGAPDSGAAYVYTRTESEWTQQAYLKAENTGAGDSFGVRVAIEGGSVVVGAYTEDSSTTGVNSTPNELASGSGAAYVFTGLGPSPTPDDWQNFAGLPGTSGSADGSGTSARFLNPRQMSMDSLGNLFVADGDNHTIRKVTPGGVVTTVAGSPGSAGSSNGTGSAARFNGPNAVAVDAAGDLLVADTFNHTIRKVSSVGVVSTLAGTPGAAGSTDGTGSAARFSSPSGITVDAAGNLYVADLANHVIRKVTSDGVVTTIAGTAGATGTTNGTGSAARFNQPCGIAIDSSGNLFVADLGNRTIRKINDAAVVTTVAGSAGLIGNTDELLGTASRFYNPNAIAVDGTGILYVADTFNHTIRRISVDGMVSTIGGTAGATGTTSGIGSVGRFNFPEGIVADGSGNVFVVDTYNHRISKGVPASMLNGCVAWWRGEDNFQDTGGTNHGTGLNGVTFAAGEVGRCLSFDGTNDSVQVPTSANLNLVSGQGWTMEGWIKPNVLTDRYLAHKGTSANGTTPYWCVYLRNDSPAGRLAFEMCPGTGMNQYDFSKSVTPVTVGVWQHIAVVVDNMGGSVAGIHYYINGVDAGKTDLRDWATSGTVTNAEPLQIGSFRGQSVFFDGLIDELSIYNRALSASEISAIHAAGSVGKIGGIPPTIATTSPLPDGQAGTSYSHTFEASGGTQPYIWSLAGGSLPAGLELGRNGLLGGIPRGSGGFAFTVRVSGADEVASTKEFSLTVQPDLPVVATAAANDATSTSILLQALASSHGLATGVAFEVSTDPALAGGVRTSPAVMLDADAYEQTVSQSMAGLAAHTTYHFRARAENALGVSHGTILSFATANTPPLVSAQSGLSTPEDTPLEILLQSNDADGDPLSHSLASPPAHGMVSINGTLATYTPDPGYSGPDEFSFTASDGFGGISEAAIIQLTVTPVNDPPTITLHGPATMTLEAGEDFDDPAASGNDIEDGPLTPTVAGSVNPLLPASYTLTYTVTDSGGLAASTTRTVTVVDTTAPTLAAPEGGFNPLTLSAGAGGTASLPDYRPQAVAGDRVGVSGIDQSPPPGTALPPGSFGITLVARDAAGNHSAPLGFEVTVEVPAVAFANGSFEENGGQDSPDFEGWTNVDGGGVVATRLQGSTDGVWAAGFNVANTPATGRLSQSFATVTGARYQARFDFGAFSGSTPLTSNSQLRVEVRDGPSATSGSHTIDSGSATLTGTTGGQLVSNGTFIQVRDQSAINAVTGPAPNAEFSVVTLNFTAQGPVSTLVFVDESTGGIDNQDAMIDQVTVTPLSATPPFEQWRSAKFSVAELADPTISGDVADPDRDGIPNLLECAFALEPKTSDVSGRLPQASLSGGHLTFTYRQNKAAGDLVFTPQSATDLTSGPWSPNGFIETAREDMGDHWLVTVRQETPVTGAPQRFVRLRVTR